MEWSLEYSLIRTNEGKARVREDHRVSYTDSLHATWWPYESLITVLTALTKNEKGNVLLIFYFDLFLRS